MPEVIEKRTRSSKTHSMGGNKYAWDGTIGSIHYKDAQDTWQNIDNEFLPVAAPWDWEMVKADYHIRVKEDFTAGQIIEFEVQGETVQFQPMALEWTNDLDQIQQVSMPQNVTPAITNPVVDLLPAVGAPSHQGTIRWPSAYGQGIDFQWRCASTRLMKTLEIANLNNLPVPQQYILDGGNPVLRLNLIFDPPNKQDVDIVVDGQVWNQQSDVQTFKTIEFVKDGEVLWGFMPLKYWDSSEDNEGQSVATLEKRGNKLYISIRVPYGWLQTATYPVFIDTDVNEQVGASLDDAYAVGSASINTIDTRIFVWKQSAAGLNRHTGARFQTVGVPPGATISTAYQELYIYSTTFDDIDCQIYGNNVDDALNFDTEPSIFTRARTDGTGVDGDGYVSWIANDIAAGGAAFYGSHIEIKDVIQEIINRGGWAEDNALVLLYLTFPAGSKKCYIRSWDNSGNVSGPKLHIEYEVGGPAGWTGIAKVNSVGEGDLGKFLGVDKADIAKIMGVAV